MQIFSQIKIQKLICSLVLLCLSINSFSPTILTFVPEVKAQPFTPAILTSNPFGNSGEILEKFDNKENAEQYKKQASTEGPEFDLVVILVDEEIYQNTNSYAGLRNEHNPKIESLLAADSSQAYRLLSEATLPARIERYAKDIQGISTGSKGLPFTKTMIVKTKKNASVTEIQTALEKLYLEGDGSLNEKNRLAGLIVIGEVPLPVVNKNGNKFVSIFPYTDFENPYYVFDYSTQEFRLAEGVDKPAAEIWHGVIKPPVSSSEGHQLLAEYFDKNHLFKIGESEYADFEKKIFYSDLVKEFTMMNADLLDSYRQYLQSWEDISYFRYTKKWAKSLFENSSFGKPEGDGIDNDGDGKIDEDPVNGYDDDGDGEDGSPLHGLINGIDDDGDGVIDNDEEGVWGFCSAVPAFGPVKLENCQIAGKPYKTDNFYHTKPGSIYKIADGIDNNNDGLIDEGIDEDDGDAFLNIDNDRDGRIDEDTSADNDADGDGKIDEDGPGDMNNDGCPGVCGFDDDNDSYDADQDFFPTGHERREGTNPHAFWDFPITMMTGFPMPDLFPWPRASEWIDEGNVNDDDEDGLVDEDGTADNDNDRDGLFDEDPGDPIADIKKNATADVDQGLPDIRSKDMIESFMKKYHELFDKFFAEINQWAEGTGRYSNSYLDSSGNTKSDILNFPLLIAAKDEFTRIYLKAVNDAIEKRIDDYVQKLQTKIDLIKGAKLTGYVILPDGNMLFANGAKISIPEVSFINFGYQNATFNAVVKQAVAQAANASAADKADIKEKALEKAPKSISATTQMYINGVNLDQINNIQACSLYRGSNGLPGSQMVTTNTVFDQQANLNDLPIPQMPADWANRSQDELYGNSGNDYEGLIWRWQNVAGQPMYEYLKRQRELNQAYAGCFSENADNPARCFPFVASRFIFSIAGTKLVNNIPESATSHVACFDLKEKSGYEEYLYDVNYYLHQVGKQSLNAQKDTLDSLIPAPSQAYKKPRDIKLLNFKQNPPESFEVFSPSLTGSSEPFLNAINPSLINDAADSPTLGALDITLEDILKVYLAGDGKDNNGDGVIDDLTEANIQFFALDANGNPNWQQVGDQLLSKARIYQDATLPEHGETPLRFTNGVIAGIKELVLRVEVIPGKKIDSIVYHKEPTIDTLMGQNYDLERDASGNFIENTTLSASEREIQGKYVRKAKVDASGNPILDEDGLPLYERTANAEFLPIDNPRYVSFRDINGQYQKVYYPNVFKIQDLAQLKTELSKLEQELNAIPINPDYAGPSSSININGYLTSAFDVTLENDSVNSAGRIQKIAENKLIDAFNWRDFDIDQKHQYSLKTYFGTGFNSFTPSTDSEKGWEILYLNSNGSSDALSMKFNKELPAPQAITQKAPVNCSLSSAADNPVCADVANDAQSDSNSADSFGGARNYDQSNFEPVFITEWFEKVMKWADETANSVTLRNTVQACPANNLRDLSSSQIESTFNELAPDSNVPIFISPIDLNNNGIPDQAEKTVRLNLRLENADKNVLRTGQNDQTTLIVEALQSSGLVNLEDSFSEVELNFDRTGIIKLISTQKQTFNNGRAKFVVASDELSGTVDAQARLLRNSAIQSNEVNLISSAENIRLTAFRRYTDYQMLSDGEAGYGIYDQNNVLIADVDAKTGYINLLSADYQLKVLPSQANKPVRLAVERIVDQEILAILYFVVDQNNGIHFESANYNFNDNFENLLGVRLKDLNSNDQFSYQNKEDDFVEIVNTQAVDGDDQLALIDATGNVLIDENHLKMTIREQNGENKPVIWVIQTLDNQDLFEIYLGAKFEVIQQVPMTDLIAKLVNPRNLPANIRLGLIKIAHAQSLLPDSDSDGLNNLEEILIGTNPFEADTNFDGIKDLESINLGIDPIASPNKVLFSDLKPGEKAFPEIVKLYRRGLISAENDGRVRPDEPITREEFIKLDLGGICVICDRFNQSTKNAVWSLYSLNPFPDNNISENYKYCVAEGKNRGIISGYAAYENAGFYVPEANISRAEATKVILETARQQLSAMPDFVREDLSGKPWFYNYALTAQREKFFPTGIFYEFDQMSNAEFKAFLDREIKNPNSQIMTWFSQPITRAEFAMMVARFIDRYDCFNNDADGDGIPDNYERYIYGTSFSRADTDGGGVNDDIEIFRGTNPLDPSDDIIKEEVIEAEDPWDISDLFKGNEGAYFSGLNIKPKTIYIIPEEDLLNETAINTEEVDSLPADGVSTIYIGATLYDNQGNIKKSDNSSIVSFQFKNPQDSNNAILEQTNVRVVNGYAETVLRSRIKTGLPVITAKVIGQNMPSDEKTIEVHALEPASLELINHSPIIPSGGLSKSDFTALMKDKNGNLTDNGVYQVNFGIGDGFEFDLRNDENPDLEGLQLSSITGEYKFQVISSIEPQNTVITANYQDSLAMTQLISSNLTEELINPGSQVYKPAEVSSSAELSSRSDLNVKITSNKQNLKANGKDQLNLSIEVSDIFGQTLTGFEGKANVKILNSDLAKFAANSKLVDLVNGSANIALVSTTKAGIIEVEVQVNGIAPQQFTIKSQATTPSQIILEAENQVYQADPSKTYTVVAKLYDNFGNLVEIDNSTQIDFEIADGSHAFASALAPAKKTVKAGQTEFKFRPTTLTGPIRIKANGVLGGTNPLAEGFLEIQTVNILEGKALKEIKPKFLYANLLGSSFGDVTKENYFGGWFIFSGKTQAAVSLITEALPKARLFEVKPNGHVEIIDQNSLTAEFNLNRIVIRDSYHQKDLFEVSLILPPNNRLQIANNYNLISQNLPGIYVVDNINQGEIQTQENISSEYEIVKNTINNQERIVIKKAGVAKVLIENSGNIAVLDNNFILESIAPIANNFSLRLNDGTAQIAEIIINSGEINDVILGNPDPTKPGVYLNELNSVAERALEKAFSGNSTSSASGYYYVDKTVDLAANQAPGLNYLSIESAYKADGVGFTGDNKNILLFSAGSTAGEANLPYASDAGIVLGDPTVRIDNRFNPDQPAGANLMFDETGFTTDIGKQILADTDNIQTITQIDFDNDGDLDLLVAYLNGDVRLLENTNRGNKYVDRGIYLSFPNGILSLTTLDINDDGWEDLVVATADSCKVDEVCVDAYLNNRTSFIRKNLNLEGFSAKNKVYQLKSADMNADGFKDLITVSDNGSIKVFYNHKGVVNKNGQEIGNLGTKINNTKNLKNEIYIYYSGMTGNNPASFDDLYFEEFKIDQNNSTLEFKSLEIDGVLGVNSTKRARDLTAPYNVLAEEDEILYTITLQNPSTTNLNNVMIADFVPGQLKINKDSIKCLDCERPVEIVETGKSLRPYLIKQIDLPAGQTRQITYSASVGKLPKVKIEVGNNLNKDLPVKDALPDIAASPEGNPTGRMVYFYSENKNATTGRVSYKQYVTPDTKKVPSADPADDYQPLKDPATGETLGLDLSNLNKVDPATGVPEDLKFYNDHGYFPGNKPQGGNGVDLVIGDPFAGLNDALDGVANDLQNAIKDLTCAGGCIPSPVNIAFFAPGMINALGVPSGYDPGLPIFGWGVPAPVTICSGQACYVSQGGRLYLSPTLTGKIAMATCFGPYPVGLCYPVVLPLDNLIGVCEAITGSINNAIAGANNFISSVNGTLGMVNDGNLANTTGSDGKNYTGGFEASDHLGNYTVSANVSTNVRIPSFPAVLTNWIDAQQSEIVNKLTDLPDIYVLLPDVISFAEETAKSTKNVFSGEKEVSNQPANPQGLRQILSDLNKIPFVDIQTEEFIIKIPALTPAEIDRFLNDAKQWVKDEKAELERISNIWRCGPFREMLPDPNGGVNADGTPRMVPGYVDVDGNEVYGDRPWKTLCDTVLVEFGGLIESVEKNIQIVEGYKQLPRQILAWRTMFTKYVVQVICYIDVIVNFFVGNVAKWTDQIYHWVDAYYTLKEMLANWKVLFDLMIDYQASCDNCTSARFTLFELIVKLFAFIPNPPVIPFPKLPDIYMDLSQIQAGTKIYWPDIKFRPEKIILPKLPRIILPDLPNVNLNINFPEIGLLPDLSLSLPELPDLPALTLPVLPDLPPPPKIPEFPVSIRSTISVLAKVFKIICLIKKGAIPIPETSLKQAIEAMTERGLNPLLPIDLGLAFQMPEISYEYYDRIELTAKVNLQLEFDPITEFVGAVADNLNSMSTNFVEVTNALTKFQQNLMNQAAAGINQTLQEAVPEEDLNINIGLNNQEISNLLGSEAAVQIAQALESDQFLKKEFAQFSPYLSEGIAGLASVSKQLEAEKVKMEKLIAEEFQDIHLVAENSVLNEENLLKNIDINNLESLKNEQLSRQIAMLGEDFGETRKLAGLRENLYAYLNDQQLSYQILETGNMQQFGTLIAQTDGLEDKLINAGFAERKIIAEDGSIEGKSQLYAQTLTLSDALKATGSDVSQMNQPVNKGVFIYNESEKYNSRVLNYEDELSLPSTLNFIDIDNDRDEDLIMSFGGNIYLKQNYRNNGSVPIFYGGQPVVKDLNDFVPYAASVQGFNSNFTGNSQVDLSWQAVNANNLLGYEINYGRTFDADQKVLYLNNSTLLQQAALVENRPNILPASKVHYLYAADVQGDLEFDGSQQQLLVQSADRIKVGANHALFAAQKAQIKLYSNGNDLGNFDLFDQELIEFTSQFSGNLEIQVISGTLVLIDHNTKISNQKLFKGALIDKSQNYQSQGGNALIKLAENGYVRIEENQSLKIEVLNNTESPKTNLELENGFYYADIRAVYHNGFRSNSSGKILLSPNVCNDRQAPMAVSGPSEREVAIFKQLEIDASKSFDESGKIVAYYLDTDLEIDSDGDGDKTNDKNVGRDLDITKDTDGDGITNNDLSDPRLFVGPFNDLETRKVMLNVIDETGNLGQQEITIKVYVPKISLDLSSENPGAVSGAIDPAESDVPVTILRDRGGVIEELRTVKANSNGKYFTDQNGKFSIDDLELKDTVVVKNERGEIIAEIDPKTGRVILKNPLYKIEAKPAQEPMLPTRVIISDAKGQIYATIFVVSDGNTDVSIKSNDFVFNAETIALLDGVNIKPLANDSNWQFRPILADDVRYPGGVEIFDQSKVRRAGVLDSMGNIYLYDPNLKLNLKTAADLRDPMIFEISNTADNTSLAEFYIDFNNQKPLEILNGNKFKSFVEETRFSTTLLDSDQDGIPDLWELQYGFDPDSAADAAEDPDNDGLTNLEEFRAGTNPLLADTDGDGFDDGFELSLGNDPNVAAVSPFTDVDRDNPYFNEILEFVQRGILAGIPAGHQSKFGYDEPILRAEFAKIMLDIFCIVPRPEAYLAPGVFYDIPYLEGKLPWYFAATKEAYFQGFITGYRGLIDRETGRTPFAAEAEISKAEAVKIILEALERERIIDLSKVVETEVYYEVYMQIAQDLRPYLVGNRVLKNNFIITAEEAQNPESAVKRGEFIAMASRVLEANSCYDLDSDNDGMPDYWERLNGLTVGIDDSALDPDNDGLTNIEEYKFGTDPQDADTDRGGILDGEEVRRGTDPLNNLDDYEDWDRDGLSNQDEINIYKTDPRNPDTDGGGVPDGIEVGRGTDPLDGNDDLLDPRLELEPGLYVIQDPCQLCPCLSTIEHTADLIAGDKILAVISNEKNTKIFSQSNLVIIKEILED